eukprot:1489149-Pyramimonas_sp.AAC.1
MLGRLNGDEARFREIVPPLLSRETYTVAGDTEAQRNPAMFTVEMVPWDQIRTSISRLISCLNDERYSASKGLKPLP